MTSLLEQLHAAYQADNLTQISTKIIQAYKSKNDALIYKIAYHCGISKDMIINRILGLILQLYHSDKSQYILDQLNAMEDGTDEKSFDSFSHILKTEQLLKNKQVMVFDDIDVESEEIGNVNPKDKYSFFDDKKPSLEVKIDHKKSKNVSYSFSEAIQLSAYGDLNKSLPVNYLEEFDEFELASSHIKSLEGAQYCKHAKIIDLSDNSISDASELRELSPLEELFLAHNDLIHIDALSKLTQLKILDLSFNQINDISPLFGLDHLKYVNLIGNPISLTEIELLKFQGAQVIY